MLAYRLLAKNDRNQRVYWWGDLGPWPPPLKSGRPAERSGERDYRKWSWAMSGKFCRSAHMLW